MRGDQRFVWANHHKRSGIDENPSKHRTYSPPKQTKHKRMHLPFFQDCWNRSLCPTISSEIAGRSIHRSRAKPVSMLNVVTPITFCARISHLFWKIPGNVAISRLDPAFPDCSNGIQHAISGEMWTELRRSAYNLTAAWRCFKCAVLPEPRKHFGYGVWFPK